MEVAFVGTGSATVLAFDQHCTIAINYLAENYRE